MLTAWDESDNTVKPRKGLSALCPLCHTKVISKVGQYKTPHFAHLSRRDCDPWAEETEWHRKWKSLIKDGFIERVMQPHRADIIGNNDVIIELQHSTLGFDDVKDRERFYGNMVWLLDGLTYLKGGRFGRSGDRVTISFNRPRPSYTGFEKPVYIHMHCGAILRVESIAPKMIVGTVIPWIVFTRQFLSQVLLKQCHTDIRPRFTYRRNFRLSDYASTNCLCSEYKTTLYCMSSPLVRETFWETPLPPMLKWANIERFIAYNRMGLFWVKDQYPEKDIASYRSVFTFVHTFEEVCSCYNEYDYLVNQYLAIREIALGVDIDAIEKMIIDMEKLVGTFIDSDAIYHKVWDYPEKSENPIANTIEDTMYQFTANRAYEDSYTAYAHADNIEELSTMPPEHLKYSRSYPPYIRRFILFRLMTEHPSLSSVYNSLPEDYDQNAIGLALRSIANTVLSDKLYEGDCCYADVLEELEDMIYKHVIKKHLIENFATNYMVGGHRYLR